MLWKGNVFLTAVKLGMIGQTFEFEAPEHDINGYN